MGPTPIGSRLLDIAVEPNYIYANKHPGGDVGNPDGQTCLADLRLVATGIHAFQGYGQDAVAGPRYLTGTGSAITLRVDRTAPQDVTMATPSYDPSRNVMLSFTFGTDADSGPKGWIVERVICV